MGLFDRISAVLKGKPEKQPEQPEQKRQEPRRERQPQPQRRDNRDVRDNREYRDSNQVRQPQQQQVRRDDVETASRAKEMILEARDEALRIRSDAEIEAKKTRQEILEIEKRLSQKEETVDRKRQELESTRSSLDARQKELDAKVAEVDSLKQQQIEKLERAAGLSREEAKKVILEALETRLMEDKANMIRNMVDSAKAEVESKSREILVDSMLHGFTDYVPENTTSTIRIADDDIKGRIIGKEGRNIKSFEQTTGVDVDLDEPGIVLLSCFDPVRREIAKVTMERLIADGRIQPARIEEVYERTKKDLERMMREEGEKLLHDLKVFGIPGPLIDMLGRFKYRYSYGQNMITHTREDTQIGLHIAKELGLGEKDVEMVKLGCLFHDIGKIVAEDEGTHVEKGVALLKKHNMHDLVVNAVAEHHEDQPFSSIVSRIVYIADAISGARPGARHESVQEYIQRVQSIEDIAKSKEGVKQAYAMQGAHKLWVLVTPEKVDDAKAVVLAREIAKEIQKSVTYPGQVEVSVIRETRAVDVAR